MRYIRRNVEEIVIRREEKQDKKENRPSSCGKAGAISPKNPNLVKNTKQGG